MREARAYLAAGAAVLLALVLIVLGTAPPTPADDPSSRVAGKAGTLALYRWLGNLGFTVHRISGSFTTSASDVIVISDPRTVITPSDALAVMGALGRGTDVVLAVSPESQDQASALLTLLRVRLSGARPAGSSVPAQPFDAGQRVQQVPMAAGGSIVPSPSLTPLLRQGSALTAVAERAAGGGRAYVLASTFPLSNDGLRDGDSAPLVLSLLERARGGSIGFDEYHHGEASAPADGASAIFGSPLGLAILLGAAAILCYLVLSGRRLGRPLPAHDPAAVPTAGTYIEAMAGLYGRSRDRRGVAARYADELAQQLGEGAVSPGPDGDATLLARVGARRPELAAEVAAVLARARALAATPPDAAALLALARDVDDLEREWAQPVATAPAQWRP